MIIDTCHRLKRIEPGSLKFKLENSAAKFRYCLIWEIGEITVL